MDETLANLLFRALGGLDPRNAPGNPQLFMDPEAVLDTASPRGPLSGVVRSQSITDPADPHSQPGAVVPPQFTFGARLPLAPLMQSLPQHMVFDILRALSPQLSLSTQTPNPWTLPDVTAGFSLRRRW